MNIVDPRTLNEHFNDLFRRRDIEGMVSLYEPDALIRLPNGELLSGRETIRGYLSELLKLTGTLVATEQTCTQHDEIALLQANWRYVGIDNADGAVEMGGRSSKVARKGPDGTWRYIVDA